MFSLGKNERLKSRKQIAAVFDAGTKLKAGPLLLFYASWPIQESHIRFGVSVSKRNFKSAVSRNKIKRRMREAYRQHRDAQLCDLPESKTFGLFVVYIGREIPSYPVIERAMKKLLKKLNDHEGSIPNS